MSNRRVGFSAEARYLAKKRISQFSGTRFFASMGLFDLIFIDSNFITRLVQLKYSNKKRPVISQKEILDIKIWIDQNCLGNVSHIWVGYVLWQGRCEPEEFRLNIH